MASPVSSFEPTMRPWLIVKAVLEAWKIRSVVTMKYYPLIDMDSDGIDKVPMFPYTDKAAISESHHLYLAEDALHNFRLYTNEPYSTADYRGYKVHCPYCGAVLKLISPTRNGEKLGLYSCPNCG